MTLTESSVFVFYRDSAQRRRIFAGGESCPAERYCLYGLDKPFSPGLTVWHSLATGCQPSWGLARFARLCDWVLRLAGGYGGDFAMVWACRRQANAADLIVSTADTVGVALVLLRHLGVIRRPMIYISMGLPERLQQLRGGHMRRLYQRAFRRVETFVAYGVGEVEEIRRWLGAEQPTPDVRFLPFGADTDWFAPQDARAPDADILSIGADPQRDFPLLVGMLRAHPDLTALIVTNREHAHRLKPLPANVRIEVNVPYIRLRNLLAEARVVVLPVRENTYSGATTVLLQAMAMAKPVVVSQTRAIRDGYYLQDAVNCRLVPPGDAVALERATLELLTDPARAQAVGSAARATVEAHFSWERYVASLRQIILERVGEK